MTTWPSSWRPYRCRLLVVMDGLPGSSRVPV
ncbi:hypothetical protein X963_5721 [Burkholderia pseudomallei MSHR7498]|nr:hypothetical protein X963_5721 [Burkholderia pseudomallei MSHR7498]